ncbi:SIR2 family protein [Psychrilyobacter atlanticus]|uniref:SIR2 family protein n=1 Tax=Psychrilyobacter atlanticus TaxID=271091 RepID=UPI0003F5758D|nr:SIR2 family protein [Psychrilyobacter atlanticus]
MEIFKNVNYNNYALWIGDNINKKLNIPTKNELALTIFKELSEDIKKKVENKERLTEVSQVFLDSATGNMLNLISLLSSELELEDRPNPYSYLSEIGAIDTIITHDHSEILESIWKEGEIHNVFCEKELTRSNVNLFKILGDYNHTERIILTSQNMRKVKKLKLYDHFWKKLNGELENKNLILLGVNLDEDTKDILSLVFSKTNLLNTARYFVTSNPISLEDESWLISNEFEFIYEDDLNFVKKMALYFNNENIDTIKKEIDLVEDIENIQSIEIEGNNQIEESKLNTKILEEIVEKVMVEEEKSENIEEVQLKIFEKEEDATVIDEKTNNLEVHEIAVDKEEKVIEESFETLEINVEVQTTTVKSVEEIEETAIEDTFEAVEKKIKVETIKLQSTEVEEEIPTATDEKDETIIDSAFEAIEEHIEIERAEAELTEEKYIVENLEIPLYLDEKTLKGEIIETEVRNRQRRLVEFREKRYPSYKVDDFSEINHYKALDIKVPFESAEFPQVKLEKKIFAGKVDIKCNDQTIYGVAIKSHMSGKYQVVDFKNHDFTLRLLLEGDKVMKFAYKISENTVNIKGRNIYIFFKNLFSGFELNFKSKKISGNFKVISSEHVEKLDIILDTIDKYLSIKKQIKTRDINLKELLKNTRSLQVLFSYYNNTPKLTTGNITIRTSFSGDISKIEKLVLSYPISINFLGFTRSFIESTEIEINSSNISYTENQLEVQAFNAVQNTTYKKII